MQIKILLYLTFSFREGYREQSIASQNDFSKFTIVMNDNVFAKAREVSIEIILDKLGAKRAGGTGNRLLYHCSFREDRNSAIYLTEKLHCDIEDMSSVYASYNDVNDWLVATK